MFDNKKLKAELVLKGVSNTELAKKLKMNNSTLSKKMNGKSEWNLGEIQEIGKIIGSEKLSEIFLP